MYERPVKGPPLEYTFGPTFPAASRLTRADPAQEARGESGAGPAPRTAARPRLTPASEGRARPVGGTGVGPARAPVNGRLGDPPFARLAHPPWSARPVRPPSWSGSRPPSRSAPVRPPGRPPSALLVGSRPPARSVTPGDRPPRRTPLGCMWKRPPTLTSSSPALDHIGDGRRLLCAKLLGRAAFTLLCGRAHPG
jgi:hypothetical protein